jgi:hypothetical protein
VFAGRLQLIKGEIMTSAEHQQVANELNKLILDTQDLMQRFEDHGMDMTMHEDYEQLHVLLATATKDYRAHMRATLEAPPS